jgi:hypothetical protein
MNTTLTASAVICAALLSGCGTAPKLPVPTGEWEDFSQTPSYTPRTPPQLSASPSPAVVTSAYKPAQPVTVKPVKPVEPAKPPAPAVAVVQTNLPTTVLPASSTQAKTPEVKPATGPAPAALAVGNTVTSATKPGAAVASTPSAPAASLVAQPVKVIPASPIPPMVVAKVTPPKPIPEQWAMTASDVTLRRALGKWAAKAGWQLVWEAGVDVPINVTATFEGDFRTAVKRLFQSLSAADVNLTGMLYSGNRVLRVTESGRRAQ